jgi:hypothetical protein
MFIWFFFFFLGCFYVSGVCYSGLYDCSVYDDEEARCDNTDNGISIDGGFSFYLFIWF